MASLREQAEAKVKKMSMEDKRTLMCIEGARPRAPSNCFVLWPCMNDKVADFFACTGEFVAPKSNEPYDQYEVGKKFVLNGMSLPAAEVYERAVTAMEKRLARGETNVPSSAKLAMM